jgi:hypothetical protein
MFVSALFSTNCKFVLYSGTVSSLWWHGVQPWWQFGQAEWHRDQLQNRRKLHNSGNMARRNKRHKIAFLYFPILNKFFDFYSFMPYFPIHRIYGNFYVGRGAIQAGQTVTKAGHHATPGWTLCQDK